MNIKQLFSIAAISAGLALSSTASASVYDFLAEANSYERGVASFDLTEGVITATATASQISGGSAFAYLDAGGGLGVCSKVTAAKQCDPSNDDNTGFDEILTLSFDHAVRIDNIAFSNGGHTNFFGAFRYMVQVDGGATHTLNLESNSAPAIAGTKFDFWLETQVAYDPTTQPGLFNQNSFYITSITAVPEASSLILLGLGLAGLGFTRRKKSA